MVIAITPNRRLKKTLQSAVTECQGNVGEYDRLAPLVILDAGECLAPQFDWVGVFERP